VATTSVSILGDAYSWLRSKTSANQAPAASGVWQVVADLNVAAPLSRAGRDAELRAHLVSSRTVERAGDTISDPSSRAHWMQLCKC
jgi:hypothetical protein